MRKRPFIIVAALLFLNFGSMRAGEGAPAASPAKPWDALWRFDTQG